MGSQAGEHPYTYRITVQGRLDDSWSNWFSGMSVAVEYAGDGSPVTLLTGPVVDQPALRGILNKLWDLNLTLISVNRVAKDSVPGSGEKVREERIEKAESGSDDPEYIDVRRKEVNAMYWITGILGLALILAPFVLGYSNNPTAQWTSIILGAVVAVVSLLEGWLKNVSKWEYWVAGLAGLLAVIAPFVLGFSALSAALWTCVILGALVAILAGYEVFRAPPATR